MPTKLHLVTLDIPGKQKKVKTNEANISQELKKHCTCTLLQAKTHATTG